ncbi:MAG: hypothetical protein WAW37_09430 [Syntrophobacteraceae bacterium]
MKEYLLRAWDFLVTHDFPTMLEAIRQLRWGDILRNAYTWLVVLPVLVALLWTKSIKILVALLSLVAFLLLIQYTLPPAGDKIPLSDILTFLGGFAALAAINLYFIFIRD